MWKAFLLVVVLILAGCGETKTVTIVVTATPGQPTQVVPTQALPTVRPTAKAAANGSYEDSSTGMQATITQAVITMSAGEYVHPKQGNVFELLHVTLTNKGSSAEEYNPFDFTAVDAAGNTYNPDALITDRPTLQSGKLPVGEHRTGWLGFEIPRTAKTLTITWDDGSTLDPPAEMVTYHLH